METCPVCKAKVEDPNAKECPKCGLIFEKWKAKVAAAVIALDRPRGEPRKKSRSPALIFSVLFTGFFAALWIFWPSASPGSLNGPQGTAEGRTSAPSRGAACLPADPSQEWAFEIPFPGEPMGLAWTGEGFLSCNRKDPWGMVRLGCDGTSQAIPVLEPAYKQKVQLYGVCWNGSQAVGIVDGAWFQTTGSFFVLLEGKKLKLGRRFPAPPQVNSLAWDGSHYWTATRRNTRDAAEEVLLYKLDRDFQVLEKWPAPAFGCQGLAWVNDLLLWGDVFDDQILLIKMEYDQPTVIHRFEAAENYLSGLAWDGQALWMTGYGGNKLERLPPALTQAWASGDYRVSHHAVLQVARLVTGYAQGNSAALEALIAPLRGGNLNESQVTQMADALTSLGLGSQSQQALRDILARPEAEPARPMLQAVLDRMSAVSPQASQP